jgi:hypothetical protein
MPGLPPPALDVLQPVRRRRPPSVFYCYCCRTRYSPLLPRPTPNSLHHLLSVILTERTTIEESRAVQESEYVTNITIPIDKHTPKRDNVSIMSMESHPYQFTDPTFEYDPAAAVPVTATYPDFSELAGRDAMLASYTERASSTPSSTLGEADPADDSRKLHIARSVSVLALDAAADTTAHIGVGIGDVAYTLFNDGQAPATEFASLRSSPATVGRYALAA